MLKDCNNQTNLANFLKEGIPKTRCSIVKVIVDLLYRIFIIRIDIKKIKKTIVTFMV